ncbi:MAG: hypothetical protein RRB13_14905 [bacterium]|nr:hypothetical protein [bacterium]
MKRILLGLLALCLGALPLQAEMGSFLVLKSAYFYPSLNGGKKVLTRNKTAYPVVGMEFVGEDKMLFQVLVPTDQISTGSGFIVETDQELKENKDALIKVYPSLPSTKADLTDYQLVPVAALLITGRQETQADFPQLAFRAVNYKGALPQTYWVDDWAGIYRPEKESTWLNQVFEELSRTQLPEDRRDRVLMGLVETGFTEQEVRQALGEPTQRERLATGEIQWIYANKKILFEAGKVAQVL